MHKQRSLFGNVITGIKSAFETFDRNGKGFITLDEFQTALYRLDLGLSLVQSQALFDVIDVNRDGTIHYTEFVKALQTRRESLASENIDTIQVDQKDNNADVGNQREQLQRPQQHGKIQQETQQTPLNRREPGHLVASQLVQKAKQNNWRTLDVFRLMDKNASGRATAGEIAQGLVILGVKNSSLDDAKHFLAFVSPNSEVMEFNELSRALKQTARGHARLGSRGKRKRQ